MLCCVALCCVLARKLRYPNDAEGKAKKAEQHKYWEDAKVESIVDASFCHSNRCERLLQVLMAVQAM